MDTVTGAVPNVADAHVETLTVLSAVGGICMIAGMVLLVISGGSKGWYPVVGGVCLVVLNYAVAKYADLIFIPVVTATGLVSMAWAWLTVKRLIQSKEPCDG
jgi:hypothetical protein